MLRPRKVFNVGFRVMVIRAGDSGAGLGDDVERSLVIIVIRSALHRLLFLGSGFSRILAWPLGGSTNAMVSGPGLFPVETGWGTLGR